MADSRTPILEEKNFQEIVVAAAKEVGFTIDPKGNCFGISCMGMQAIFVEGMGPVGTKEGLDHYDERAQQLAMAVEKGGLNSMIQQAMAEQKISKATDYHPVLEFVPFIQDVSICQDPRTFAYLFEQKKAHLNQDIALTLPIVLSKKLETEKGIVEGGKVSGIYSKEELVAYLMALHHALTHSPQPPRQSVVFFLTNKDHAIVLGYLPRSQMWVYLNPNEIRSKRFFAPEARPELFEALAVKILTAFSANGHSSFVTRMMGLHSEKTALFEFVKHLNTNPQWQCLHQVTEEKARLADSDGFTWLCMAIEEGNVQLAEKLINANSLIPPNVQKKWFTMLCYAAQNRQADIIKMLLNSNLDPNEAAPNGDIFPLLVASGLGDLESVKALLEAGANIDQKNNTKQTALMAAASGGHLRIVRTLLKANADPDAMTQRGRTALFVALVQGHTAICKELLKGKPSCSILIRGNVKFLLKMAEQNNVKSEMEDVLGTKLLENETSLNFIEIAKILGHHEIVAILAPKKEEDAMDYVDLAPEKSRPSSSVEGFTLFSSTTTTPVQSPPPTSALGHWEIDSPAVERTMETLPSLMADETNAHNQKDQRSPTGKHILDEGPMEDAEKGPAQKRPRP